MKADARRAQLLAVARQAIIEERNPRCTLEELARRAGVRRGLLNHYFGGRDGIVVALYEDTYRQLSDDILAAVAAADDLASQVRAFAGVWLARSPANEAMDVLFAVRTDSTALKDTETRLAVQAVAFLTELILSHRPADPVAAEAVAAMVLAGAQFGLAPAARLRGLSPEATADLLARTVVAMVESLPDA